MNTETKMNFNTALIIMILLWSVLYFADFLFDREPSNLFKGSFLILLALLLSNRARDLLPWGMLSVIIFQGIIILYYYVFNDILLFTDPFIGFIFIFLIVL